MKNPCFTIIIPTKDRAQYLHQTLRTCMNQDYDNFKVIVSDDGSSDNTKEIVEEASRKDHRIKYVSPGRSVGMLDNFEFALDFVEPGYVMALGGDDGLLPNCISRMWSILSKTGLEILSWPTATFFYPKTKIENGQIIFPHKKKRLNNDVRIIDSNEFLERQAKKLFYISDFESPMIYVKGVVSTRIVDIVKSRSADGRFYSCSTPDGYSGIVLAGEVDKYAFVSEPLSIHGVSPSSQGLNYLTKNESAKKQAEDFYKNAKNKPMHAELASQPYSPLITLMTADFLLTARDLPGWKGKFSPIDYKTLLANSLSELNDGLFPDDRIKREIDILYNIANQHGLVDYFQTELNQSKRNSRKPLEGNAISTRLLYLDAIDFGIHNIFDASYFTYSYYQMISKLGLSFFYGILHNSIKYRLLSVKKQGRLIS